MENGKEDYGELLYSGDFGYRGPFKRDSLLAVIGASVLYLVVFLFLWMIFSIGISWIYLLLACLLILMCHEILMNAIVGLNRPPLKIYEKGILKSYQDKKNRYRHKFIGFSKISRIEITDLPVNITPDTQNDFLMIYLFAIYFPYDEDPYFPVCFNLSSDERENLELEPDETLPYGDKRIESLGCPCFQIVNHIDLVNDYTGLKELLVEKAKEYNITIEQG